MPDAKLLEPLRELGDGDYLAAYVTEQGRVSNIAPFKVDSKLDLQSLPAIELVNVEPPPYYDLPLLGIGINGAPGVNIENVHYSTFCQGPIMVDGVKQSLTCIVGAGLDPVWTQGTRWLVLRDLSGFYSPVITPGVSHEIALLLPSFTTKPASLSPLRPLGDAWDKTVYPADKSHANVLVKENAK